MLLALIGCLACRGEGEAARVLAARKMLADLRTVADLVRTPSRSGVEISTHALPLVDPWGKQYRLVKEDSALRFVSAGPDRILGTEDDISDEVAQPPPVR